MSKTLCLVLAACLALSAPGCCGFNPLAIVESILGAIVNAVSAIGSNAGLLWLLADAAPEGEMRDGVLITGPMTREEALAVAEASALDGICFLGPGETPPPAALVPPCEGAVPCLIPLR